MHLINAPLRLLCATSRIRTVGPLRSIVINCQEGVSAIRNIAQSCGDT